MQIINWFWEYWDVWLLLLIFWAVTDGIDKLETRYGNIKGWPRRVVTANKRRRGKVVERHRLRRFINSHRSSK